MAIVSIFLLHLFFSISRRRLSRQNRKDCRRIEFIAIPSLCLRCNEYVVPIDQVFHRRQYTVLWPLPPSQALGRNLGGLAGKDGSDIFPEVHKLSDSEDVEDYSWQSSPATGENSSVCQSPPGARTRPRFRNKRAETPLGWHWLRCSCPLQFPPKDLPLGRLRQFR